MHPEGAAVDGRIRFHVENLTDCHMKNAVNIGSDASSMLVEWDGTQENKG